MRCVITEKSADLIYFATDAWNQVTYLVKRHYFVSNDLESQLFCLNDCLRTLEC